MCNGCFSLINGKGVYDHLSTWFSCFFVARTFPTSFSFFFIICFARTFPTSFSQPDSKRKYFWLYIIYMIICCLLAQTMHGHCCDVGSSNATHECIITSLSLTHTHTHEVEVEERVILEHTKADELLNLFGCSMPMPQRPSCHAVHYLDHATYYMYYSTYCIVHNILPLLLSYWQEKGGNDHCTHVPMI
jgi:hypothetical protein